jgi:O-acetyl-ADP-ribose deacetylase (regulator of RNase III)
VSIRYQDLFASEAQVIVNAANSHLGGGGIDGLIHRRGGAIYREQHEKLQTVFKKKYPLGYASMIESGNLINNTIKNSNSEDIVSPIEKVIVVAGPQGETSSEKENQLYSCYYNALVLAHSKDIKSIAFPSVSTGIFSFPKDVAAAVSLRAIHDFINKHPETSLKTISIHFLKTEDDDFVHYENALKN